MEKCKNDGEMPVKPDVFTYYCAHIERDDDVDRPCILYFRTKKALFAACSKWLDQGEVFTIYEEGMSFSDRQPPWGA